MRYDGDFREAPARVYGTMASVPRRLRIAVVGAGISGLGAAWLLDKRHDVTLYEAAPRAGGHANTVDIPVPGGTCAVDTGFIVFNDRNYPELSALFAHLGVAAQASDMSFAASLDGGRFEYAGSDLAGLFGQRRNALRPRFWRMVRDILRFYRAAPGLLALPETARMSLGDFLDRGGWSRAFAEDHLLPMGAAIWSATAHEMRAYPLAAFLRFFERHGLLSLNDRPQWFTVAGGSRSYVDRLLADFGGQLRLGTPVAGIRRIEGGVELADRAGSAARFDHVVLACHADQALALLGDPDGAERATLGAFAYTANTAVLHRDSALMPRRRRVWASWNYIGGAAAGEGSLCVTYWMNRLQNFGGEDVFVTLNPPGPVAEEIARFDYSHPRFDHAALEAQARLAALQGIRNTWFCGAHFGSGFHEDGIRAGLDVAEALGGGLRPWRTEVPGLAAAVAASAAPFAGAASAPLGATDSASAATSETASTGASVAAAAAALAASAAAP